MKKGSIQTRLDRLEAATDPGEPVKPWLILETEDDQTYTASDGQTYSAADLPGLEEAHRLIIVERTHGPIPPLGAADL